jgi:hypothetical protein
MTTTTALTVGAFVEVRFPSLNKNDDLIENDTRIQERSNVSRCRIARVVELSLTDWAEVAQNLLTDREALWGKIGGQDLSPIDGEAFAKLCAEHGADADQWTTWIGQPELIGWFRNHSHTEVVAVTCAGQAPFFVNTEGHLYARYVGRLVPAPAAPEPHSLQHGRSYLQAICKLHERRNDEAAAEQARDMAIAVDVRSGWFAVGSEAPEPEEFQIVLCTGGPAVRVTGTLDGYGEPNSIELQRQDWFTPWEEIPVDGEQLEALEWFASLFWFGE